MRPFSADYLGQQVEHGLLLIMLGALELVNIHKKDLFLSEKIRCPDALQIGTKFAGGSSTTFLAKL